MQLSLPLTKKVLKKLRIGDVVELTGNIYTARDAAHKRISETIERNEALPFDLKQKTIFYAGPCPAPPGRVTGSIGPTTSARMDRYLQLFFRHGMAATIGKGERSDNAAELCRRYSGIYFLAIGGAATLYADKVKEVEVIAYHDLETESIKRLFVEDFKVIVGIDTKGHSLQSEGIDRYRQPL